MQRDVNAFLLEYLGFFQSFDVVKLYYDNGQAIVTSALHAALENALSGGCLLYREAGAFAFALAQAADMLCAVEVTARKFQAHEPTHTEEKMFGNAGSFRKNYLKPLRRKRFGR